MFTCRCVSVCAELGAYTRHTCARGVCACGCMCMSAQGRACVGMLIFVCLYEWVYVCIVCICMHILCLYALSIWCVHAFVCMQL